MKISGYTNEHVAIDKKHCTKAIVKHWNPIEKDSERHAQCKSLSGLSGISLSYNGCFWLSARKSRFKLVKFGEYFFWKKYIDILEKLFPLFELHDIKTKRQFKVMWKGECVAMIACWSESGEIAMEAKPC